MHPYGAKHALLGNLIDYAGTFPPAALPLPQAMRKAVSFRREGRHPWLLSKVVVNASDLPQLTPEAWFVAGSDGTPIALTVIGPAVESLSELPEALAFGLREVRRFNTRWQHSALRQRIESFEIRLPEDTTAENLKATLQDSLEAACTDRDLGVGVYCELSLHGPGWQNRLAALAECLRQWIDEHPGQGSVGVKIRTGGTVVPEPRQLAEVIAACTTDAIGFKATQGLHHPFTQAGPEWGFINLFGAFALAQGLGLSAFGRDQIARCLLDTDPGAFVFEGMVFRWREFSLTAEQIESARRRYGGTFGSCSLAEPDEFLVQVHKQVRND